MPDPSFDQDRRDDWQGVIDNRTRAAHAYADARGERESADLMLKSVVANKMEVARALEIGTLKDRENFALQTDEYVELVRERTRLRILELHLLAEMNHCDLQTDKHRSEESTSRKEMELAR